MIVSRMRIAVPEHLRKQILHEAHGTDLSGHFGISKVYKKLKRRYWWPNLRGDVKTHIQACMQYAVRAYIGGCYSDGGV